jgi:hypothetical protein
VRLGAGARGDGPWRCLLIALVLQAGGAWAASLDLGSSGDHVRVILDTSKSMCGAACGWKDPPNDPGRLSILSTLLLHDLLKPDPRKADHPDSFAVIPFGFGKWTGEAPPPSTVTPRRAKGMAARQELMAALGAAQMPFDAMNTYYAPGIVQALADLPPLSSADSLAMTRTIVLITDGQSVNPEADRAYIEQTLLPALAAQQTRLYAILFGPDATQRGEAFFAAIRQTDEANVRAGRYAQHAFPEYFVVRTGEELPATMIRLFSAAFGYLHLPEDRQDRVGASPVRLDLHRGVGPTEAAIVALRLDPAGLGTPSPPRQSLSPPPGGSVNLQHLFAAREPGGSYSLRWELKPSPGDYPLRIEDGGEAAVFVLRPTNLTVALREHGGPGPGVQPDPAPSCFAPGSLVTMADRPCQLDFLVTSAAGTKGIPPKLTLRYWIKQPRPGGRDAWSVNDADGAGIADAHHWEDLTAGGRRYYSQTQFSRSQVPGGADSPYTAHVTVRVDLEHRTVAVRGADDPFEVRVYPRLGIAPQPPAIKLKDPASGALARNGTACTSFTLTEDFGTRLESAQGTGPAQGHPGFNVRAFLSVVGTAAEGPLRDARFTLDGEGIGLQSTQSQPGAAQDHAWSRGRQRVLADLVERNGAGGRHQLCVTLGPYADGDPLRPPGLTLRFILDHPPYDHFEVIRALPVEVLVAKAPGLLWRSALPFLLLLAVPPLVLLLRPRYALPPDLGYATAGTATPEDFAARQLPPPHPLGLLLGRRAERAVLDSQGRRWGWVRPDAEGLYALRLASGVGITDRTGAEVAPGPSGLYLLPVHQPYRLNNGEEGLWLRLQFL